MNIDFHTHGKLAKRLPFSSEYAEWQFREAKQAGLKAICLTEHYNSEELARFYKYLGDNLERDGDSYLYDGLRIFVGMEIDIAEQGHILVIGELENIASLYETLSPYLKQKEHPQFEQLLTISLPYSVLIGAGHPFRASSRIPTLPKELLRLLDFIELNGHDVALDGVYVTEKTNAFAEKLGLPVVAGSDTHQSIQFGCIYTKFENDCTTISALKKEIVQSKYTIEYSDYAYAQVKNAKLVKRALKEIHALGSDYVSLLF
jgi:histidinol phosphatase-like PHP family hydrolase